MIRLISVFLFVLLGSFEAYGQPLDVEKHLLKVVKEQVKKECLSCEVEFRLLNKKSIDDIAIPDSVHADHWKGQTNLLLKLGDQSRIITADIRWKDRLAVAKRNIRQGKVINEDDLRFVTKDVTFLKTAYINNKKNALGFIGRRIFQRGQIIDEAQLKKPLAIRYGQPIKVLLEEGQLKLTLTAKARGAGAIGESIPVYITSTRKKVFGKIISKNRVRVQ